MPAQITAPSSAGVGRGNFVLLRAGTLRLLLPQDQVGDAEYVEHTVRPTETPGLFAYGDEGGQRLVVALSDHMLGLSEFPRDRFVLTRLANTRYDLSFAWHEVRVLIDTTLERRQLPAPLGADAGPIEDYTMIDDEPVLCSTAEAVVSFTLALTRS
ncbi:MAG: hypothetical protein ABIR26_00505 [Ramlibacter sp.]